MRLSRELPLFSRGLRDRLREPEEAAKNAEIRQEGERGGEGEKGAAMFCVKEAARGSSELSAIAITRHHFDAALFLMSRRMPWTRHRSPLRSDGIG